MVRVRRRRPVCPEVLSSPPISRYTEICICWFRGGVSTAIDFRLVAFDDDGPNGEPGSRLLDLPVTASGVPFPLGSFYSYNLEAAAFLIPPEAVWIGAEWYPGEMLGFSICSDDSPTTPVRPIRASNDGAQSWFDPPFFTAALLIRARREPLLFLNGFESGDTSEWSVVEP